MRNRKDRLWARSILRPAGAAPSESLGEPGGGVGRGGDGSLGGPVVVRGVSGRRRRRRRGVDRVLREGAELCAEPGDLAKVGGMDEVALPLPPLGPPVLEPNLE